MNMIYALLAIVAGRVIATRWEWAGSMVIILGFAIVVGIGVDVGLGWLLS